MWLSTELWAWFTPWGKKSSLEDEASDIKKERKKRSLHLFSQKNQDADRLYSVLHLCLNEEGVFLWLCVCGDMFI